MGYEGVGYETVWGTKGYGYETVMGTKGYGYEGVWVRRGVGTKKNEAAWVRKIMGTKQYWVRRGRVRSRMGTKLSPWGYEVVCFPADH